MIELMISGGAGNQYCQYAFARYIMNRRQQDDLLRINWKRLDTESDATIYQDSLKNMNTIRYESINRNVRGFMIPRALIHGCSLAKKPIDYDMIAKMGIYMHPNGDKTEVICRKKKVIICANYENPQYYDEIRESLIGELSPMQELIVPKAVELSQKLQSENSVCMSVRVWREDLINERRVQIHPTFFCKALNVLEKKIGHKIDSIFVSSNNIEWCKKWLDLPDNVIWDEPDFSVYDRVHVMTHARYYILSNSSFSWWIQYLCHYDQKIVVIPYIENFGLFQWKAPPAGVEKRNWIVFDVKNGLFK